MQCSSEKTIKQNTCSCEQALRSFVNLGFQASVQDAHLALKRLATCEAEVERVEKVRSSPDHWSTHQRIDARQHAAGCICEAHFQISAAVSLGCTLQLRVLAGCCCIMPGAQALAHGSLPVWCRHYARRRSCATT